MSDAPPTNTTQHSRGGAVLDRLFAIDGRSLVALRVSIGLLIVADVVLRLLDVGAHYSDQGVLPRSLVATVREAHWTLRAFFLDGSAAWSASLLIAILLLAACLVVGYRTRLVTVVLWVLVVSLHARNPLVLNRGDETLRVLLLWATLLPLGAWTSWDRRRSDAAAAAGAFRSWATAGIQLQVAAIYLFTWLLKTGFAWRDGSAVWLALNSDRLATPLGRAMLEYPGLLEVATHAIFWFELAAPLALFWPWRTAAVRMVVVPALVVLHLTFVAFLGIGLFPYVSIAALWVFVPGSAWDRLVGPRFAAGTGRAVPLVPAPVTQILAVALTTFVLTWNYTDAYGFARPMDAVAHALLLEQRWSMFAPEPAIATGWYVIAGEMDSGAIVELFPTLGGGSPVAFTTEKPEDIPGRFPRYRWNRLFFMLMGGRHPEVATASAAYACRLADVRSVRIVLMSENAYLRAQGFEPRPIDVAEVACSG